MQSISKADFEAFLVEAESYYTKDVVNKGWFFFAVVFYTSNLGNRWGEVEVDKMLDLIRAKKSPNIKDMLQVAFSVIRNEAIFKDFLASLQHNFDRLFEYLIWHKTADQKTVESITGLEMLESSKFTYNLPNVKNKYTLFRTYVYNSYNYKYNPNSVIVEILMPPFLKRRLFRYFPTPINFTIVEVPEPVGNDLVFFKCEEAINFELPNLITYYMQDQIKYSDKGRPLPSGMKKLQRTLQLTEFYKEDSFNTLRSMLLSGILYGYDAKNVLSGVHNIIRQLFTTNFNKVPLPPFLFGFLKGCTYFQERDFYQEANRNIHFAFSTLPQGKWVTIKNLYDFIEGHAFEILPLDDSSIRNKINYEVDDTKSYDSKKFIENENMERFIKMPMVYGSAFIFAAYGLLEICYEATPPNGRLGKDWFSEYDNLKAVKLTPLGAYALGLSDVYDAPTATNTNKLVFEENSLMIRAEGNPDIAQIVLTNYAQKVAANRYQFSQSLFLKDCKKSKDIINKITLFKQTIGQTLPPFWENYLAQLVANSKRIADVNNAIVYQLKPEDKELHRLLVNDDALKKMVIKAEQFKIIVATNQIAAFRNRLKEFGILLE